MAPLDYERLTKIVGELDALVPQGDAVARIERRRDQYGLVANQSACLKMGTAMLKVAAAPVESGEVPGGRRLLRRPRPVARRKLDGMFGDDSALQIARVERHDVLPAPWAGAFDLRTFFNTMAITAGIAVFAILGLVVTNIWIVDTYVIPKFDAQARAYAVPQFEFPDNEEVAGDGM